MPIQPIIDTQSLSKFKEQIKILLPLIDSLNLDDEIWKKVNTEFVQWQRKKLTRSSVIHTLVEVIDKKYENLVAELTPPRAKRSVSMRGSYSDSPSPTSSRSVKRWKNRRDNDEQSNLVIKHDEQTPFNTPIKALPKKNLQPIAPITSPDFQNPQQENPTAQFTTPKGTRYRELIQSTITTPKGTERNTKLYEPVTPYGNSEYLKAALDQKEMQVNSSYKCPEPITFEATREQMEKRSGKRRPCSQKQLTGLSAHNIFKACGSQRALKQNGNQYHWSHMIAHFLGGPHTSKNLVPTTAYANYNTLDTVEKFIASKLSAIGADGKNIIDKINITVTPVYHDPDSKIADILEYRLSWEENKFQCYHKFSIYAQSTKRFKLAICNTLGDLSKLEPTQSAISNPIKETNSSDKEETDENADPNLTI